MSQRRARLMDGANTALTIGLFVFLAVMAVFDALTGRWWQALFFLVLALINLYSLRMLRLRVKDRQALAAKIVALDAYIAAADKKRDDA